MAPALCGCSVRAGVQLPLLILLCPDPARSPQPWVSTTPVLAESCTATPVPLDGPAWSISLPATGVAQHSQRLLGAVTRRQDLLIAGIKPCILCTTPSEHPAGAANSPPPASPQFTCLGAFTRPVAQRAGAGCRSGHLEQRKAGKWFCPSPQIPGQPETISSSADFPQSPDVLRRPLSAALAQTSPVAIVWMVSVLFMFPSAPDQELGLERTAGLWLCPLLPGTRCGAPCSHLSIPLWVPLAWRVPSPNGQRRSPSCSRKV